jgi:hypothetical protein
VIFLVGCAGAAPFEDSSMVADPVIAALEDDSGSIPPDTHEKPGPEIVAGIGIGPAALGETYGHLVSQIGPPDSSFEYFRVIFAVWLELGIEVVFSVGEDGTLTDDAPIVSVGTKLPQGYRGAVTPGMTQSEAEQLIGPCTDVVDGVHCYHPIGIYLAFNDQETIQTVAIHPPYTMRDEPPEMVLAMGGER